MAQLKAEDGYLDTSFLFAEDETAKEDDGYLDTSFLFGENAGDSSKVTFDEPASLVEGEDYSNIERVGERVSQMGVKSIFGLGEMAANQDDSELPDYSFLGNDKYQPIITPQGAATYLKDIVDYAGSKAIKGLVDAADLATDDDIRETLRSANQWVRKEADKALGAKELQYTGNEAQQFGWQVAEGIVNMAPALAAGWATRNPNVALGMIGGQVGGNAYSDYMEKTGDHDRAMAAAKFNVMAEVIPESIPVLAVLRKSGAGKAMSRFLEATLGEGAQEGLTEIMTSMYDDVELEAMTLKDAFKNIKWDEVGHAAMLGIGVGAGLSLPGTIADLNASRQERNQPDQANQPPELFNPTHQAAGGQSVQPVTVRGQVQPDTYITQDGQVIRDANAVPIRDYSSSFDISATVESVKESVFGNAGIVGSQLDLGAPQQSDQTVTFGEQIDIPDIATEEIDIGPMEGSVDYDVQSMAPENIEAAPAPADPGPEPKPNNYTVDEVEQIDLEDEYDAGPYDSFGSANLSLRSQGRDDLKVHRRADGKYEIYKPEVVDTKQAGIVASEMPATEAPTVKPKDNAEVDIAANQAATSPLNERAEPTDEEKELSQYEKGRMDLNGMPVAIESPKGSERTGTDESGRKWSVTLEHHYGDIENTTGADGDPLDIFLGPDPTNKDLPIFVINQVNPKTGEFDETKTLSGFATEEEARAGYLSNYEKDWKGLGSIVQADPKDFQTWLKKGDTTKEYPGGAGPATKQPDVSRETPTTQQKIQPKGKQVKVNVAITDQDFTAQMAVVDINDLVISNDTSGAVNPLYPKEIQPRDRQKGSSKLQIQKMANNLKPELLEDNGKANGGAPIIGPDGVVESGNGRSLAVAQAYQQNKGEGYRQHLIDNAASYGLTAADIEGIKNPVLVRVRQGDMTMDQRAEFARQSNQSGTAPMTPAENARADAERISSQDMSLYEPSESGNILAASNDAFLRLFGSRLGDLEVGGLTTPDGRWTKQMADRVQAAVFYKAYGDENLLALVAEEADPDIKNILSALNQAAPSFARARSKQKDLGELDIISDIVGAIDLVRKAKAKGTTVGQLVAQQGIFENVDPVVGSVAEFIESSSRSSKRMGLGFSQMGKFLESELDNLSQDNLFDMAPATKADLVAAANKKIIEEYGDEKGIQQIVQQEAQDGPTDRERTVESSDSGRESRESVGAEAKFEENGEGKIIPGKPFLVARIGSGKGGLENRNAGNTDAVALHLLRSESDEGPIGIRKVGKTISVYEVTVNGETGSYETFNARRPGKSKKENSNKSPAVGREEEWTKNKTKGGRKGVSYSFPDGADYTAQHLVDIDYEDVKARLREDGLDNMDDAGTIKGGLILQEVIEKRIAEQQGAEAENTTEARQENYEEDFSGLEDEFANFFAEEFQEGLTVGDDLATDPTTSEPLPATAENIKAIVDQGEDYVPQNTVKAYKLFTTKKGEPNILYPLFVDANIPVPIGEWTLAQQGETHKGKVKSKIGHLANRPGWHSSDGPIAPQIGRKDKGHKQPNWRPGRQVWAEVEIPADIDWQTEANDRADHTKAGKPIARTAHITDQIPAGGFYHYKTNPNQPGDWMISGALRVNRILSDEEVAQINAANETTDLPRKIGPDGNIVFRRGEKQDDLFDDAPGETEKDLARIEREKDAKRNGAGKDVDAAQSANDLFANDGQLPPDLFARRGGNYEELDGKDISYEIFIEDENKTVQFTVDAGQAMRDTDARIKSLNELRACI